jgi:hypothetical protein
MDTMTQPDPEIARAQLQALYGKVSKHSAYQTIPDFVSEALGYAETIQSHWRGDRNRLDYIGGKLTPAAGERWCDFGANTGFFTYTLAHRHPAARFVAIEANAEHAEFLTAIRQMFAIDNVEVAQRAIALDDLATLSGYDVMLHLNVLHHAGADFDRRYVSGVADFPAYAVAYLSALRAATRTLVFQIGSNLWGDKAHPLIASTDDVGKLNLISAWIRESGWRIAQIAYPKSAEEGAPIVYEDLDPAVVERLNHAHAALDPATLAQALRPFGLERHVGEFYRRALYILA